MGIAFLVRYDSILFTGPLLVWLALRHRREPKLLALTLAPAAGIALAWLATAEAYFGDLFPTPFYVKSPSFGAHRLLRGGVYELQFLIVSGAGLLLAASLGAVAANRERRVAAIRVLRARWWLATGLTAVFAYGLSAGQVHMMFSFRLFVAYLPALTLLALDLVTVSLPARRWQSAASAGLVGAIVLVQIVMAPLVYWSGLNPL